MWQWRRTMLNLWREQLLPRLYLLNGLCCPLVAVACNCRCEATAWRSKNNHLHTHRQKKTFSIFTLKTLNVCSSAWCFQHLHVMWCFLPQQTKFMNHHRGFWQILSPAAFLHLVSDASWPKKKQDFNPTTRRCLVPDREPTGSAPPWPPPPPFTGCYPVWLRNISIVSMQICSFSPILAE